MIIKSLELENFRNYNVLSMNFDKGTNILYGDNAQGKTNILEAIFLSGGFAASQMAFGFVFFQNLFGFFVKLAVDIIKLAR